MIINLKILKDRMKLKLFYCAVFIIMSWTFTSCESITGCKVCRQVTYVDEKVEQEGNESEYCGAELIAIEAASDVVTGNTRVSWECR
jgi:hypothetical protein